MAPFTVTPAMRTADSPDHRHVINAKRRELQAQAFQLPYFFSIGENEFENIVRTIGENFPTKRCMLLTGRATGDIYGSALERELQRGGFLLKRFTVNNNSLRTALDLAEQALYDNTDAIVGLGGGRVLDVAKYTAHLCRVKFISVPTAVSHDGLASPIAVLTDCENRTRSIGCTIPSGIIVDLNIVKSAPLETRRAGVGDVLSNLTALSDWKLACSRGFDTMNHFAYMLSEFAVSAILNYRHADLDSLGFLRELVQAQVLSGLAMEIAGSSRPCSGSEHLFSHAADALGFSRRPHGIQVAAAAVMSRYFQGGEVEPIMEFLRAFDLPATPIEAGFTPEECQRALAHARSTRPDRYTIFDEVSLTQKEVESMLNKLRMTANRITKRA